MILTLEGKAVEVPEFSFGTIKKITAAYNRLQRQQEGYLSEGATDDMSLILSLALGKTPEEVDGMKIKVFEVVNAMPLIAEACGLVQVAAGEAPGVDGTNSTSTS